MFLNYITPTGPMSVYTIDMYICFSIAGIVSIVGACIWGNVIIGKIRKIIKEQLLDFHSIKESNANKTIHQAQLELFQTEFKVVMLDKYKEFEETIMGHIKDSKLIATIFKESGYAKILDIYKHAIEVRLDKIARCDLSIVYDIKQMKTRQDNRFWGYGAFIPARLIYKDEE